MKTCHVLAFKKTEWEHGCGVQMIAKRMPLYSKKQNFSSGQWVNHFMKNMVIGKSSFGKAKMSFRMWMHS